VDLAERADVLHVAAALESVEPNVVHGHLSPLCLPTVFETVNAKHTTRL